MANDAARMRDEASAELNPNDVDPATSQGPGTKGPDPAQWPVQDRPKERKPRAIKGTKGPDPDVWGAQPEG